MKTPGLTKVLPSRSLHGGASDAPRFSRLARSIPSDAPAGLRLRTFLSHRTLDRQLAAGRAVTSPQLALRARQLTDLKSRRELAGSIRGAVRSVERTPSRSSAITLDHTALKFGRAALNDLADQLEMAPNVTPRGVLLARKLMTDGHSPVYDPSAERTVTEVARQIQELLRGDPAGGDRAA